MTIIIDRCVLERYDVLGPLLQSAEISYETTDNPLVENAFTFRRENVYQGIGDDGKVSYSSAEIN